MFFLTISENFGFFGDYLEKEKKNMRCGANPRKGTL